MTDLNLLDAGTIAKTDKTVNSVNGSPIRLTHKGDRTIDTDQLVIRLKEVYFAKDIKYNLLSAPVMTKKGVKLILGKNDSYIEKNGTKINLEKVDGLWALPEGKRQNAVATLRMELGGKVDAKTWHERLGHVSNNKLRQMISRGLVTDDVGKYDATGCETCKLTCPKRRPVPKIAERSGNSGIQVDYMPMGHGEIGWRGEVGAYIYSCRTSKIVKAYPVKDASTDSAISTLKLYSKHVAPFLRGKIDFVQTDAGTQFNTDKWKETCIAHKMMHITCPIDHQAMNGQVERTIGILAAKTRALLMQKGVEKKYWPLALDTAVYLFNRTSHESLNGMSPLQVCTGRKPDLWRLRVFGCKAFVQIPKPQRKGKLGDTAWAGAMAGYSTQSPEWIILDMRTGKLRNAYSVTFDEGKSGFTSVPSDEGKPEDSTVESAENQTCPPVDSSNGEDSPSSKSESEFLPSNRISNNNHDTLRQSSTRIRRRFDPNHVPSGTLEMQRLNEQVENDSTTSESSVDDNVMEISQDEGENKSNDDPPAEGDLIENQVPGACMALAANEVRVPASWRQALGVPEWQAAMEREVHELESKQAWELVPRPENAKVLPGVWNYRVKKDENGNTVKYKARWCVDGSREGFTRPPENVFSPVAELSTVIMLLAIASKEKQPVMQADFPNAYVNADIEEEIFVCQPKGLEQRGKHGYVCKLRKALYGYPISGRRWNQTLTKALASLGFRQTAIDHCLFYRENSGVKDLLVIYVDDVIVTSTGGEDGANKALEELSGFFELKKLGKARHILGLGIHQEEKGIFLEQSAYAKAVLEEADYLNAKTRGTPWDGHLMEDENKLSHDETVVFRRVLGQLAYLANGTRPDLAWAVSRLASKISSPTRGAWERIKRLLRYLNGTKELGLHYEPSDAPLELETFVDSSFAVDK